MSSVPNLGDIDLTNFSIGSMLRAGVALRRDQRGVGTMEDAAQLAVSYFYTHCLDAVDGERACALVRFYKTHEYGELGTPLKRVADRQLGSVRPSDAMRCLVLLATAGDVPAWNAREHSQSHQVIPLPNAEMVRRAPMILRLIEDMGLDVNAVVEGSPAPERGDTRSYDVFHVEEARGSPHIPAQRDFVEPYGIKSVVGFGGLLRSGELFAVILFSRVRVPPASAARFRTIALDLRSVLFQLDESHTWRR
jgi:hypothetical protein